MIYLDTLPSHDHYTSENSWFVPFPANLTYFLPKSDIPDIYWETKGDNSRLAKHEWQNRLKLDLIPTEQKRSTNYDL